MNGRAFILAISNRKGGTGKTTTTVNLGAEFAARDFRTLVVDLDTQGHAAIGLGLDTPAKGVRTAHAIFDGVSLLAPAIVTTSVPNMDLIPADPLFDGIGAGGDLRLLARRLSDEGIASRYDVILLDTPPSLDLLLMNALAAADGALIPLSPHPLGLNGVQQLTRLFFRIGSTVNPGLRLVGLLPIMVDRRVKLHQSVLAEAASLFGNNRMLRGIRNDIRLAEAFAARQPIRRFAPKSRGALDYHLLAEELRAEWGLTPRGSDD